MQLPLQALTFVAGIVLVATRPALDHPSLMVALLIAAALLMFARARRFVIPFTLGVTWAWLRALTSLPGELPPNITATDLVLIGDIVSLPETQAGRTQFDFAPREAHVAGVPSRVRLTWFGSERGPRAAERWRLEVRLRPPRGFANPGGYDYEGELFRSGVGATGYVRESAHNRRLESRVAAYPVLALRAAIVRRIERTLGDSAATGVIAGLAVGASQGISPTQWRVFAATGTTHLIAISGLHVTMVAALAMLIAQSLWRLPRRRSPRSARADVTCLCGALAALVYSALAGFAVPTQRTLIMLLAALSAMWLRRAQPPTNVLSLALIAVLVFDPHAVLTAGLWLSFLAVAAIFMGVGSLLERPRPLRAFLATQGAVSVALVPATALLFGSLSLVAPAANLLAIPLFSGLLVPGTLLAIALLVPLPMLGELTLGLTARLFEISWPALEWAASFPGALVHLPPPGPWQSLLLGTSTVVLMSPLPGLLRMPGLLLLCALVWSDPARPAAGDFTVTTLDVGQGLAIVVRTRAHTLLFDAGPVFRSGRSAGDLVVVPYLHSQGVRRLDMLVTSHADKDHVGGVAAVERALTISTARHGGVHGESRTPSYACEEGEAWVWDGVRFEFLHPAAHDTWSDNDGSCVLLITAGVTRALLTGDIEHTAEEQLLTRPDLSTIDVVIVPHHGSRTSSSEALVRRVRAALAIVSAGAGNRWQFPHEPVVHRWCAAGTHVLGTADWGAITIDVDSSTGPLRPRAYRLEQRRYWHARTPGAGRSLCPGRQEPRLPAPPALLFMRPTLKYHPPSL